MTETNTKTTLTIELDEEAVYNQMVKYNDEIDAGMEAQLDGDSEKALEHAITAINIMSPLMESVLPAEMWNRFTDRYRQEHADDMIQQLLKALGGDPWAEEAPAADPAADEK